jgi:hypothetical protein
MDTVQQPSQADIERAELKARVEQGPAYVPPREEPVPVVHQDQMLFNANDVYRRPWYQSQHRVLDEPTPANLTPEQLHDLEVRQHLALAWRKLWETCLESLPRPHAVPESLGQQHREVDEKIAALMEPVLAAWREGGPYKELVRVRQLICEVERELAKSRAKLSEAQSKRDQVMLNGQKYSVKCVAAVQEATDDIETSERFLAEIRAIQLINATTECHADLHDRLLRAAGVASQEADGKIKATYRELARTITEALPEISVEQKLRAACTAQALQVRFGQLLADLT